MKHRGQKDRKRHKNRIKRSGLCQTETTTSSPREGEPMGTSPKDLAPLSNTVIRQADFDATVGHCVVSDGDLACAIFFSDKTISDSESFRSVCYHGKCLSCPTVV